MCWLKLSVKNSNFQLNPGSRAVKLVYIYKSPFRLPTPTASPQIWVLLLLGSYLVSLLHPLTSFVCCWQQPQAVSYVLISLMVWDLTRMKSWMKGSFTLHCYQPTQFNHISQTLTLTSLRILDVMIYKKIKFICKGYKICLILKVFRILYSISITDSPSHFAEVCFSISLRTVIIVLLIMHS